MRRLALGLALLLVPGVAASEPFETLIDWNKGHHVAPTRVGVEGVDLWRASFELDECRRALLLDLLYSPEETLVQAQGVGEAAIVHEFRAEIWTADGAQRLSATAVRASGYGKPLGVTPGSGPHEIRLFLTTGASVDWSLRLRARDVPTDPACLPRLLINEVELNPAGANAGAQWVELANPGPETVDASAWILRWGEGASLTLPDGALVAPGGHLVVDIPAFTPIPTSDAILTLDASFGYTSDTSPALSDAADDGLTWQRTPDRGPEWTFRPASRGAAN